MRGKFNDITGQKFGRLTVISYQGKNKSKHSTWLCKCECGNTKVIDVGSLLQGRTRSCGCLDKEAHLLRPNRKTHGAVKTRLYRIWEGIKKRCHNQNNSDYPNYGARGIIVCEEWRKSFTAFRDWALANGYEDTLSIDRIDPNGNHEPSNCRWATAIQQVRNRRITPFLTYNGETHSIADWAEILGVPQNRLYARKSFGWTDEQILTTPLRGRVS